MSVRRERELSAELGELRQQIVFYRDYVSKLKREQAAREAQPVEAPPPPPPVEPTCIQEPVELVGMAVGQGMMRELWHVSNASDADIVHKAYEVYQAISRAKAPAEHTRETSVGLLVARSAPGDTLLPVVEMRLFRSGRADVVVPITTAARWEGLRRADVVPNVPLDLG